MNRLPRLLSIVLLCLASGLLAADDALYVGVVDVDNQSEAERRAAMPLALAQVLVKLSGLRELPEGPEYPATLERAGQYVVAFGYREMPRLQPDGSEIRALQLEARFSADAVDEILSELRLPRWRPERPPVVLWVVVDDGRGRALTPVEYQDAYDAAELTARLRGQPLEWPGISAELQEQMDLQLLWGGYTDQLVADGADNAGVLVAAARREAQDWNVRWSYTDSTLNNTWRTRGLDLKAALEEGVNQLVDFLASANSIGIADMGVFRSEMLLTGLRGSDDYARCLSYLENLSLVDAVVVESIGPEGLRLNLQLNAEPGFLESSLLMDGVIESADVQGTYRLVP